MNIFLDPAILFFIFGLLAGFARSNLEIPPAISKFLSLYLNVEFLTRASKVPPKIDCSIGSVTLTIF